MWAAVVLAVQPHQGISTYVLSLKAEVTPKRYAPWLAKAAPVVVLLDALNRYSKTSELRFFRFLIKPDSRRGEMDFCCEKKGLGA